ncbi:MAG: heavy-metal-associated domain-containing protein [Flavobacteriales bacterium]|nr:heavy-metal-associated domain-containing protein [Flavobacteriales bacterium]
MKTTIRRIAISVAVLFIAFIGTTNLANAQETAQKVYVKIQVDGLSCPFCAYGLEKKLKDISGSKDVSIELEAGEATLSVLKDQQPTKEEVEAVVNEAGFTPREITFSDKPFKVKDDE